MSRRMRRAIAATVFAVATGIVPATVPVLTSWTHSTADAYYYGTSRRVARRTSRRTSYRQNEMYQGTHAYPVAVAPGATAAVVTSLPAGCVSVVQNGITYHRCGSTLYQPFYQGDVLVYAPVP